LDASTVTKHGSTCGDTASCLSQLLSGARVVSIRRFIARRGKRPHQSRESDQQLRLHIETGWDDHQRRRPSPVIRGMLLSMCQYPLCASLGIRLRRHKTFLPCFECWFSNAERLSNEIYSISGENENAGSVRRSSNRG